MMCSMESEIHVKVAIKTKAKVFDLVTKADHNNYKAIIKAVRDSQAQVNEALTSIIEEEKCDKSNNKGEQGEDGDENGSDDEDEDDENGLHSISQSDHKTKRRKVDI